ncbi:MAG: TIGR02996 domain-containing protein [Gemmataceae bacterium]|nr:TIGR02996 domain-containing protein [Gemmataceae bacterium]
MTDGYALLRAIEEQPDEDTPRLAYADWLDEHAATDADRAWAELIRVQCSLARTPPGPERGVLAVREARLLRTHAGEWAARLPAKLPRGAHYGRGFPALHLSAAVFARHAAALAGFLPLDWVRISHAPKALAELAGCPQLAHVRCLVLDGNGLRNHHLPVLLGSPHLTNVRMLNLNHNHVGTAGARALAGTTALPALRVLAVHDNPIKDAGLTALTDAAWFGRLTGLHASLCGISGAGLIRMAGLPQAGGLRDLDMGSVDGGDPVARAVLDSPHLKRLERLWLWLAGFGPDLRAELEARFGPNLNPPIYRLG